ncbi:MAG: hypothetical protein FWF20_11570 [Betaproteobacteria bacterium]|nr:hypothetical protein [Betaproteobacteria bacterium]MCL2887389.1 hypothetical protein [Betaproteobacteria bacterium]
MPPSAVSLKLRNFRNLFGIAAPRVVVRSHVPWQWYLLPGLLLILLIGAGAWLLVQHNEVGAAGRELQELRLLAQAQQNELETLRLTAGTRQNAVGIEIAAQRQLLSRIKELELENGALKEDMRIFERLIPVVGEDAVVRVENVRVTQDDDGRYRYRLLIAFQPTRQKPEFAGRLQLLITYMLDGAEQRLTLPEKADATPEYQLTVKHFLRREGGFELPAGARLTAVEARLLQGATLMTKRLTQL